MSNGLTLPPGNRPPPAAVGANGNPHPQYFRKDALQAQAYTWLQSMLVAGTNITITASNGTITISKA